MKKTTKNTQLLFKIPDLLRLTTLFVNTGDVLTLALTSKYAYKALTYHKHYMNLLKKSKSTAYIKHKNGKIIGYKVIYPDKNKHIFVFEYEHNSKTYLYLVTEKFEFLRNLKCIDLYRANNRDINVYDNLYILNIKTPKKSNQFIIIRKNTIDFYFKYDNIINEFIIKI